MADSRAKKPSAGDSDRPGEDGLPVRARLAELERRSLLAEQARQQAHAMRTPLNVIALITESLKLEFSAHPDCTDRLERVISAVSDLSSTLSRTVDGNRFAEGPKRLSDPVTVASKVVEAYGGHALDSRARPRPAEGEPPARAMMEVEAFEAALVHAMRLIGIAVDSPGCGRAIPLLEVARQGSELTLSLGSDAAAPIILPHERADYVLMQQAAERALHDMNGGLTIVAHQARIEIPLLAAERPD